MGETIKILFTGDFYGVNRIEKLIQTENYSAIYNDFLSVIKENDIAITNLEAPLTESSLPILKTGPALKGSPKTANAFKYAGFNLITLANNHIMDYGEKGLSDTITFLKNENLDYIGAGKNFENASRVFYKEIKGKKLAFINFTENEWSTTFHEKPGANPLNPIVNYYNIQKAKSESDFVFVIVHGGHEMYSLPSPRMQLTYRFFADAGADIIVGHHTHCISGYEVYNRTPIFYSLGNFIFDKETYNHNWNEGLAVQFTINGDNLRFNILPFLQNDSNVGIQLLNNEEKTKIDKKIQSLNTIINDHQKLHYEFEKFCLANKKIYDYFLEPHSSQYIFALQKQRLLPSFLSGRKRRLFKNLIRCEAHRDVVLKLLT
jgi:hypothetical protein